MREEQTEERRMKKRGAYKISHIRIIEDDEPKVNYEELMWLQTKYKMAELIYKINKLNEQKSALEQELLEMTYARRPESL